MTRDGIANFGGVGEGVLGGQEECDKLSRCDWAWELGRELVYCNILAYRFIGNA
jgi:hypothetical protein